MNGYYAFSFNGETIAVKFGLPAYSEFMTEVRDNPAATDKEGNISPAGIAFLIYFGYKNWCTVKRERPKYDYEQFMDWLEDCTISGDMQTINDIMTCYTQSKFVKVKEEEPETKKKTKKSIGSSLKVSATAS